jgi:phenylalanyl-tRNA synthetase beta chain
VGPLTDIIVQEIAAKTANRESVPLRIAQVKRHLGATADGKDIPSEIVQQYLSALGCSLSVVVAEDLQTILPEYLVKLPTWRLDLEREIDLIEEVARVYGYNKFADTLPSFAGEVRELPHAAQEHALRETLLGLGYCEAVSSTFASEEDARVFGAKSGGAVPMGNPLSEEAGVLRPALTPGMASMLAENLHRNVNAVRLFELGTVFTGSTAAVQEEAGLALGATGAASASALYAERDALFYEVKGALEALLSKFDGAASFDARQLPAWIEPGRGARALLDGEAVAVFGELSAAEAQRRKLRQSCVLAEVRAQALLMRPLRRPVARELSRFQAVERDFSFVFADAVRWESIAAAVRSIGVEELQSVAPAEVYRDGKGKAVAAGSYSLLLRVVFQSHERTLTEDELTGWSEKIVAALTALGGAQRA